MINLIQNLRKKRRQKQKNDWIIKTQKSFGTCGKNVCLRYSSNFIHPEKIILGNNIHIGENAWWRADGGISVGDNTIISRNCTIFSANHDYLGSSLPFDDKFKLKEIKIGPQVWIGMNVMIAQGVTIGEGAIIAMGTVVTKDVPPLAIVGSSQERVIKYRDKDHYYRLLNNGDFLKVDTNK